MLHKLRRAMVNAARDPLHGEVEVDDTWVGGVQAGLRGSRQLKGRRAALVLVAVEKRGKSSGRVRMRVIPDFKAKTILPFLTQHVSPGSTIYTGGLKSFEGLTESGFQHVSRAQPRRSELMKWEFPRLCRGGSQTLRIPGVYLPLLPSFLPKPVAWRASCRCSCFCFSPVAIRPL